LLGEDKGKSELSVETKRRERERRRKGPGREAGVGGRAVCVWGRKEGGWTAGH
jgi:hypothetical protein